MLDSGFVVYSPKAKNRLLNVDFETIEKFGLTSEEVAREMAEGQSLRYAELTCTPYTSVLRGIPIEAYTEAIEDARVAAERDFGLVLRWIYDIPGESGLPAADALLFGRHGRPGHRPLRQPAGPGRHPLRHRRHLRRRVPPAGRYV